jgi:hypothetical protein
MTDITSVLIEMQRGQALSDINQKFNDLLKSVLDTGIKGELTIKLKIKPAKFAIGGAVLQIETEHEAKVKKPELSIGKSLFFVDAGGRLSRDHPDQIAFEEEQTKKEAKANG